MSDKFNFTKTKKEIFDVAIGLFAKSGFENVSLRDISRAVNIKQASVYYHFQSKLEILDTIYDYYIENFGNNQSPVEELKEILRKGTKEDFCNALMFTFEPNDQNEEQQTRLFLITKIIYMRIYQDDRARDIFLNLMNSDIEKYVQEVLEYGVSIEVIEDIDIPTYAKFLIGQRHIMGMKAFANPNYEPRQLDEEKRIMKMNTDMLTFRNKQ